MSREDKFVLHKCFSILFLLITTLISFLSPTLTVGLISYFLSYITYVIWVLIRIKSFGK